MTDVDLLEEFNYMFAVSTTTVLNIDHRRTEVDNTVSLANDAASPSKEWTTMMQTVNGSINWNNTETVGKSRYAVDLIAQ